MATLNTILNKFSIKNFIADLPRLLNECTSVLYNCITSFYDEDNKIITCDKVVAGRIDATSIFAQNLSLKSSTGESLTLENIVDKINDLESRIHTVEINEITDKMIDDL